MTAHGANFYFVIFTMFEQISLSRKSYCADEKYDRLRDLSYLDKAQIIDMIM